MAVNGDTWQDLDDAREAYVWGITLRTFLTVLLAMGAVLLLMLLTRQPAWTDAILQSAAGLLAGLALVPALAHSRQTRAFAGLVLGGITLPLIVSQLTGSAGTAANAARRAATIAFVVHGGVGLAAGLLAALLWHRRPTFPRAAPVNPSPGGEEEGTA